MKNPDCLSNVSLPTNKSHIFSSLDIVNSYYMTSRRGDSFERNK